MHPGRTDMRAKLAAVVVAALALPSAALALQEGSSGTRHSSHVAVAASNPLRDGKYLPRPTPAKAAPALVQHVVVAPSNPLRDGKYLPQPAPATTTPAPVQIVRVIKPRGFDLRDASIGAAFGALLIAIVGTLVLVTLRERAPRVTARTGA
jgi:hypothetical protein